jgi:hypothetical protein
MTYVSAGGAASAPPHRFHLTKLKSPSGWSEGYLYEPKRSTSTAKDKSKIAPATIRTSVRYHAGEDRDRRPHGGRADGEQSEQVEGFDQKLAERVGGLLHVAMQGGGGGANNADGA